MRRLKTMAMTTYKPQAKTVDIQRVDPDAVVGDRSPVSNHYHSSVLSETVSATAAFPQGVISNFRIQDSLPFPVSIRDHQMEWVPVPVEPMEVDGHGGDYYTNRDNLSVVAIPMDTNDDFSEDYFPMEVDRDITITAAVPAPEPVFPDLLPFISLRSLNDFAHTDHEPSLGLQSFDVLPLSQPIGFPHETLQPILHTETGRWPAFSEAPSEPAHIHLSSYLPSHMNFAYMTEGSRTLGLSESNSTAGEYGQYAKTDSAQSRTPPSNIEVSSSFAPSVCSGRQPTTSATPFHEEITGCALSSLTSSKPSKPSGSSAYFDVADLYLNELNSSHLMPIAGASSQLSPPPELGKKHDNAGSKYHTFAAPSMTAKGTYPERSDSDSAPCEPNADVDGKPLTRLTANCVMTLLRLRYERLTREPNRGQNGSSSPASQNDSPRLVEDPAAAEPMGIVSDADGEKMGVVSSAIMDDIVAAIRGCDGGVRSTSPVPLGDRKLAPNVPASLSEQENSPVTMFKSNAPANNTNQTLVRFSLSTVDLNIPPQKMKETVSPVGLALAMKPTVDEKPLARPAEGPFTSKSVVITSVNLHGSNRENVDVFSSTPRPPTWSEALPSIRLPSTPPPTPQGIPIRLSEQQFVILRRDRRRYRYIRLLDADDTPDAALIDSAKALPAENPADTLSATEGEQRQWTSTSVKQWIFGPGTELKVLPGAVPNAEYHDASVVLSKSIESNPLSYRMSKQLFGW